MRLVLDPPADWTRRDLAGQTVHVVPGFASEPDLALFHGPLVPFPHDTAAWAHRVLGVEIEPTMRMTDKIVRRMHTATGFGLDVVETSIVDAGGKVYEHRLGAFYKFLEWGAVALVRATDRARFEAHQELFVTLFQA